MNRIKYRWLNQMGYGMRKIPGTDPALYDVTLDDDWPLTLLCEDTGWRYQPDRHEVTDMGSIPRILQSIIPKDRFLLTWLTHDSGYQKGGLYVSTSKGEPFVFVSMPRARIDALMLEGIVAEGCLWWERQMVYRGVRLGGWVAWNRKRRLNPEQMYYSGKLTRPIVTHPDA